MLETDYPYFPERQADTAPLKRETKHQSQFLGRIYLIFCEVLAFTICKLWRSARE